MKKRHASGFTLIELLVVISILAILATTVFVALDPARRFAQARNSRRANDVTAILTAIHEYIVDNNGSYPAGLDTTLRQLGSCGTGGATPCTGAAGGCLSLSTPLVKYLKTIPVDPSGSAVTTGYSVIVDANGIVTVNACSAELSQSISASR